MTNGDLLQGMELWLGDFEGALVARDAAALGSLFGDPAYLRDNGVLTWDFRQFHGRDAVVDVLIALDGEIQPRNLRVSDSWPAPALTGEGASAAVQAFFDFETAHGVGIGLLRANPAAESPYGFEATAVYTRLEGLRDVGGPEVHPRGKGFTPRSDGETWMENRLAARSYAEGDPEVLVVGAGQAGLVAAAFLRHLGVETLIVDKNERVGDNWRKRYESLALHNPVEMNGFPFLPFPPHYPEYMPKDMVGEWLEIYSRYLDLNVWGSTEFRGATYDENAHQWTVTLGLADGTERTLRPLHIVHATGGIGGKPAVPDLPGLSSFAGQVMHSSGYTGADDYDVRRVIVVGTASSGHDISLDLYHHGVEVTMVQRGPVVINHVDTANLAYAGYIDPELTTELVDISYGIGLINPLREAASQQYHQMAKEMDGEILAELEAAGLRLGDGIEGRGWLDLFLRTGGGYYLNTGASEAIASGGIKVLQADRIVEFVAGGAKLDDGTIVEADLVVLATGYQNRQVEIAEQFGAEIAAKVGPIARLDEEGEWASMWGQSGQRGLWVTGGGFNQIRPGCRVLSLLVKADIDGSIPDAFRRPPKNLEASRGLLSAVGVD